VAECVGARRKPHEQISRRSRSTRLLRVFARRGLLRADDARVMRQWQHGGGFSVDGSVRIEAVDRAGRERLLRYCARPPFALDRLRELHPERVHCEGTKPGRAGGGSRLLTPLELIDRIAALVPPPRIHRHRYYGVLAPNRPLRPAVTAMAVPTATHTPTALTLSVRSHRFLRPLPADRSVRSGSTPACRAVLMMCWCRVVSSRLRFDAHTENPSEIWHTVAPSVEAL
jgi:hypothetical protein